MRLQCGSRADVKYGGRTFRGKQECCLPLMPVSVSKSMPAASRPMLCTLGTRPAATSSASTVSVSAWPSERVKRSSEAPPAVVAGPVYQQQSCFTDGSVMPCSLSEGSAHCRQCWITAACPCSARSKPADENNGNKGLPYYRGAPAHAGGYQEQNGRLTHLVGCARW